MLGTEPGFSTRAANVLNGEASSLAQLSTCIVNTLNFFFSLTFSLFLPKWLKHYVSSIFPCLFENMCSQGYSTVTGRGDPVISSRGHQLSYHSYSSNLLPQLQIKSGSTTSRALWGRRTVISMSALLCGLAQRKPLVHECHTREQRGVLCYVFPNTENFTNFILKAGVGLLFKNWSSLGNMGVFRTSCLGSGARAHPKPGAG